MNDSIWQLAKNVQSITAVRLLAASAGVNAAKRGIGSVIVIGVDGVSYDVAEALHLSGTLHSLRSVFPTTSVTAFLSSILGIGPEFHGIWGPVLRIESSTNDDSVVNLLRSRRYRWGDDWVTGGTPLNGTELNIRNQGSLFHDWQSADLKPIAISAEYPGMSKEWLDAIHLGAVRIVDPTPAAMMSVEPLAHTQIVIGIVRDVIAPMNAVWAHINLDPYIHLHGYDAQIAAAISYIDDMCCDFAAQGIPSMWYADHGMMRTKVLECDRLLWEQLETPLWCRGRAGGAGRTRWLYPHARFEGHVLKMLLDGLGTDAIVIHRDELGSLGLLEGMAEPISLRVGEVVAIATGERFPIPDPNLIFEHGGISEQERRIPLVIYG